MSGLKLIVIALAALPAAAAASETVAYTYDARGRLVNVAHTGTINDGLATSYSFDKADNRLRKEVTGGGCVAVVPAPNGYRVIPCATSA